MKRFVFLLLVVVFLINGVSLKVRAASQDEDSNDIIRHIPLWELGHLSDLSYMVGRKEFVVPAPFQAFLTTKSTGCDFQGSAFYDAQSGVMIIAFTGTEMNPPDPADVISDAELVEGQVQKLIKDSFLKAIGKSEAQRDKVKVQMKPMLKTMVIAAQLFTRDVYQKAEKEKINLNDFILTGHSLGGFLAQIVGIENGLTTFTFNAPGAKGFNKIETDAIIENHIRRDDVVGNCGEHIGKLILHPNVPVENIKDALLFAKDNHSIERFYKDLKNPPAATETLKDKATELVDQAGKEIVQTAEKGGEVVVSTAQKTGVAVKKTAKKVQKKLKKLKFW
ncbi:MAG: hypothetical protein AB1403_10970 [Candidatus Riflebacteria bacterium]